MLGSTNSAGSSAGGIWNALSKKSGGGNNNSDAKSGGKGATSAASSSTIDPNFVNLTSLTSAGLNKGTGPALQRLLVVGHSMGGKRSFIDRLRRSAEPSMQESGSAAGGGGVGGGSKQFHGKFGAARAQKEEKRAEASAGGAPIPKTISAIVRGSGVQYTSIAYRHCGPEFVQTVVSAASSSLNSGSDDSTTAADRVRTIASVVTAEANHSVSLHHHGGAGGTPLLLSNNSAMVIGSINSHANSAHAAGATAGGGTSSSAVSKSSGGGGASSSSSASASVSFLMLNNTVVEVIAVDAAEALETALPTYASLQNTAVVIVLDAIDIANSASVVAYWSNAINNRVRTLAYYVQQSLNKTSMNTNNNNNSSPSAAAAAAGGVGISKSAGGLINLQAVDVRVFLEKRAKEIEASATVFSATDLKNKIIEHSKLMNLLPTSYTSSSTAAAAGNNTNPAIPESLRILLPSMIVLNKIDLLDDLCKNDNGRLGGGGGTAGNAGGSSGDSFSIALQHARWLALQRGAAFTALSASRSSTGGGGGVVASATGTAAASTTVVTSNDFFAGLWTYLVYGLVPGQFEHCEYLLAQREKFRQHLRDGMSTEELAEESRKEVEALEARRRRRQQQKEKKGGDELASTTANKSDDEDGDDAANTQRNKKNDADADDDDAEDADYRRGLLQEALTTAVLLETSVKNIVGLSSLGATNLLIPRGLDEVNLIEKQTTSAAFISIRFGGVATTTNCETHATVSAAAAANAKKPSGEGASPTAAGSTETTQQQQQLSAAEVTRRSYEAFLAQLQQEIAATAARTSSALTAAAAGGAGGLGGGGGGIGGFGAVSTASPMPSVSSNAYLGDNANNNTNTAAISATAADDAVPIEGGEGGGGAGADDDGEAMIWDD